MSIPVIIAIAGTVAALWLVLTLFFWLAGGDFITESMVEAVAPTVFLTAVVGVFLGLVAIWGWAA